jgi:redox-sensitive bicupin YhaK (pirin superfamily)
MSKKQISFSGSGQRADIGDITIYRMLPNRYADAVGPFVFLDHVAPVQHSADKSMMKAGTGAHPHRGIATLTYILNGEGEHFDSRGHHAKVHSGGVQWMKAGNGIIHDETMNTDSQTGEMITHGFQFWINLPSTIKAEAPEYLSIQANEVPQQMLSDKRGWLKVIVGEYENLKSKIPNYSRQFLYHIHLEAGKQFSIETEDGLEFAALLPEHNAVINDTEFKKGDFIEFGREEGTIEINNKSKYGIDIILFGGEKYIEPIVAQGPFVMNTQQEIAQAYRDFHAGKYGEIKYNQASAQTN